MKSLNTRTFALCTALTILLGPTSVQASLEKEQTRLAKKYEEKSKHYLIGYRYGRVYREIKIEGCKIGHNTFINSFRYPEYSSGPDMIDLSSSSTNLIKTTHNGFPGVKFSSRGPQLVFLENDKPKGLASRDEFFQDIFYLTQLCQSKKTADKISGPTLPTPPSHTEDSCRTGGNQVADFNSSMMEQTLLQMINDYRRQKGLSALKHNPQLSEIAREHSDYLARNHMGANHNYVKMRYRKMGKIIPWRSAGENVAYNMGFANPVRKAFKQWLGSRGHHRLIKKSWGSSRGDGYTGVGVVHTPDGRFYFTQVFLEKQVQSADNEYDNDNHDEELRSQSGRKRRPRFSGWRRFFRWRY